VLVCLQIGLIKLKTSNTKIFSIKIGGIFKTALISNGYQNSLLNSKIQKLLLGTAFMKTCQHIVGVNPMKIINHETDMPNEIKEAEKFLIFHNFQHYECRGNFK